MQILATSQQLEVPQGNTKLLPQLPSLSYLPSLFPLFPPCNIQPLADS